MADAPDPAAEDFYARLGVERGAPADAVRAAYREAVRRHPPERDAEAFKRVREAFETLGDETARAEYDLLHDDGSPAGLLARAERAMGERDWAEAEHLLKRVLLDDPEAGRPRNMLALCFLHQEKPGPAAAQYDRLLARPEPDTVWLTNAGHAYRQAGRPDDARAAVLQAAARPDADQAECAVALTDLAMDRRDAAAALAALADGARRVAPDHPGAAALALREVDVHLAVGDAKAYRASVARAEAAAGRAGWQQQGAYRLGVVAWRLIDGEAFDLALPAAEAARRLQPDDLDYDAQVEVATALGEHQLARARQIVRTHVAFGPGRWLPRLGQRVVEYCDRHQAFDGMRRVRRPPNLMTVNGVGPRLVGRRDYDEGTRSYVSTLYACLFFVPLVPLARYRVRDGDKGGWTFLGRLPLAPPQRVWLGAVVALLVVLLGVVVARSGGRRPPGGAAVRAPVVNVTAGDIPPGDLDGARLRQAALNAERRHRDSLLTTPGTPAAPPALPPGASPALRAITDSVRAEVALLRALADSARARGAGLAAPAGPARDSAQAAVERLAARYNSHVERHRELMGHHAAAARRDSAAGRAR